MDEQHLEPCPMCTTPGGGRWRQWCPFCGTTGMLDPAARRAKLERIRAHMKAAGYVLVRSFDIDLSGAEVGTTGTIDWLALATGGAGTKGEQ